MIAWQEDLKAAGYAGSNDAFAKAVAELVLDIACEWPDDELFMRPENIRFFPSEAIRVCNLIRHRYGILSLPDHAILSALVSTCPPRDYDDPSDAVTFVADGPEGP